MTFLPTFITCFRFWFLIIFLNWFYIIHCLILPLWNTFISFHLFRFFFYFLIFYRTTLFRNLIWLLNHSRFDLSDKRISKLLINLCSLLFFVCFLFQGHFKSNFHLSSDVKTRNVLCCVWTLFLLHCPILTCPLGLIDICISFGCRCFFWCLWRLCYWFCSSRNRFRFVGTPWIIGRYLWNLFFRLFISLLGSWTYLCHRLVFLNNFLLLNLCFNIFILFIFLFHLIFLNIDILFFLWWLIFFCFNLFNFIFFCFYFFTWFHVL